MKKSHGELSVLFNFFKFVLINQYRFLFPILIMIFTRALWITTVLSHTSVKSVQLVLTLHTL